ncbi:LysR family transcriptional regulator [Filibacter tadaridae]|uniref:HTH-type transcriptional regulator CysL n=1 Tax=Filibacter tadaridae TaxID=2483811 RepID=A0A3P5X9C7_9BACL|nr:LysR family transcriptional regulator [Filibacter tadaridae]VDC26886.1 HTH-type transcriptional regulator CysL [Filibacter tadaridae]
MDQHLQVFIAVAERKNFSRAAEELHMTQPAVSQYIQTLERDIGTRLLERSNKYVRLNQAGEIVYYHAKEIVGLHEKMKLLVDDLTNTASGSLSIGASYTFGEYILPHIIAKMHEKYPLIHPAITIGNSKEIEELVASHQLDVGIIENECRNKKLSSESFAEDAMFVVMSKNHPFSQVRKEIGWRELEEETWIIRENGSGTRGATDALFRLFDCKPKKLMEFGSTQLIKESVEAGLGISLLSQWALRKEFSIGNLQKIQVKGTPFTRQFTIVTQTPFQTKAVQVFLELVREHKDLSNLIK